MLKRAVIVLTAGSIRGSIVRVHIRKKMFILGGVARSLPDNFCRFGFLLRRNFCGLPFKS